MSDTIPTNAPARRRDIARLLALGIVRCKKRQHQRNVNANDSLSLDISADVWIDSTTAASTDITSRGDKS